MVSPTNSASNDCNIQHPPSILNRSHFDDLKWKMRRNNWILLYTDCRQTERRTRRNIQTCVGTYVPTLDAPPFSTGGLHVSHPLRDRIVTDVPRITTTASENRNPQSRSMLWIEQLSSRACCCAVGGRRTDGFESLRRPEEIRSPAAHVLDGLGA